MFGKIFDSQMVHWLKFFWRRGRGGEVAEVEQRGAKSGRLTEGPQRVRYATAPIQLLIVKKGPEQLHKYAEVKSSVILLWKSHRHV
jgi:hypothetical protein